ncbi:MAG TPA: amino acid--tRNA ligase-related protein [Candidatus Paceibacterota bacterium]
MASLIEIRQERLKKVAKLRELGIDPYPSKSARSNSNKEIIENFAKFEGKEVTLAGRLMSKREHGSLMFADLQDPTSTIQLYIKNEELRVTNKLEQCVGFDNLDLLDIGDIVEARGIITKTKNGTVSLAPRSLRILAKSIRSLPEKWEGVKDPETLHRQRYLDLIIHPEHKWRFQKASEILFAIREFLNSRGFLEIKTPIIQPTYGGTSAKPFKTRVNALGVDYYLAVAHELYLKRLITAGFENVYNLVGYFRNEGIDRSHNPEFNMIETMTAYKNYEFNMDLTEELYTYIGRKVFGKTVFKIEGEEVDFAKPWRRVSMFDLVKEHTGQELIGEKLVEVFENEVEKKLIQPTFVMNHPVEVSPLAKQLESDPRFVERFEIFIGGIEGGDNWSELNDPIELFKRFQDQHKRRLAGDEEAHPMDIEFIEMMEYGMPPTTGLGPGIERLTMMFTEAHSIDEVLFFPMLRPAPHSDLHKEIYGF